VATPPEGIVADVIVVHSFDELDKVAASVKGKIVVYDVAYISYGITVIYRTTGAIRAAKYGAVAALVRSITPFSIASLHTGMTTYDNSVPKIPTAAITIEDAQMFSRMQNRGQKITLRIKMDHQQFPDVISRNIIAEIRGSTHPDQVIIMGGHIDSWDVGQGAMDDGGGAFVSWQAISVMRRLGLRPKRTIRVIMWTCEEFGGQGAQYYYEQHKKETPNVILAIESDIGTFTPTGFGFSGTSKAYSIIQSLATNLGPINASVITVGGGGTDIDPWMRAGVPGMSLNNQNEKYFFFHHSDGDMMTVMDPHDMDLCSATMAVMSYLVADLDQPLPR